MAPKFYAVRKGKHIGIYHNWNDCKRQVHGYAGSQYKSFSSLKEAEDYLVMDAKDSQRTSQKQDLQGPQIAQVNQVHGYASSQYKSFSSLKEAEDYLVMDAKDLQRTSQKQDLQGPQIAQVNQGFYRLEFDGASKGNPGKAGAGAVLRNPDGSVICTLREGVGVATNNVAEYRAVIRGLKFAVSKGIERIHVQGDSNLVCMQVQDLWKTKNENIVDLSKEAKELKSMFKEFRINHIAREYNSEADALANDAIELKDGEWSSN